MNEHDENEAAADDKVEQDTLATTDDTETVEFEKVSTESGPVAVASADASSESGEQSSEEGPAASADKADDADGADNADEDKPEAADKPAESGEEPEIPLNKIDNDALWVVRRLRAKGHEAYLTGGCVRDLLLGREPKDFDVATAAHPDEVKKVFRNCRLVGRRFRLAHVLFAGGKVIETATFRKNPTQDEPDDVNGDADEADQDVDVDDVEAAEATTSGEGEAVDEAEASGADQDLLVERDNEFGNVEEDAVRRDFTINGLFYDPIEGKVIDYVNGREDLEKRLLRSIGPAHIRFQEDPVRILRAIKFATRMGFNLDDDVQSAMREHAGELLRCAPARLLEEINRLLTSGHAQQAMAMCAEFGVTKALLPELYEAMDAVREAPKKEEPEAVEAEPAAEPPVEEPAPRPKTVDIESFEGGDDDDDDDDVVGIAAQLSGAEEEKKPEPEAAEPDMEPGRLPERAPPQSPEERWALLDKMLGALDEVAARGADVNSAVALSVLLHPAYEAAVAAGEDGAAFVDRIGDKWAERIRMTRRDRESARLILGAQESMLPGWRYGAPAKSLVSRPWFRDALLLQIVKVHAEGGDFSEIQKWKAVAEHHKKKFKQPKKGERVSRPRRPRRQRSGGRSGGGRSSGGRSGGGRGRSRSRRN